MTSLNESSKMLKYPIYLLCWCALLVTANLAGQSPLRVDINANGRSDMRTEGWQNWLPSGEGSLSQDFGGIKVTLKSGDPAKPVQLFGNKAWVVDGVTLGADGARVSGASQVAMEIVLEGLSAGEHRFVGYHHFPGNRAATCQVQAEGSSSLPTRVSQEAMYNDEVAQSYVEFFAIQGAPVVLRLESVDSDSVVLNAFALDVSDPQKKALIPFPRNLERHANGDDGQVTLSWKAAKDAVRHRVHVASDRDPQIAESKLKKNSPFEEVTGNEFELEIIRDSLLHYAWRVDTVDGEGKVTEGDVWRFRVRHLAFPEAEGYGRFAIGGRGGRVLHVTNLNDSGPGSLRAAVEAHGPRTVVFDVSGLITLQSKLIFRSENEFLTLAGQTAPGKGICIRNYTFGGLGARDVVVRYVRLRLGDLAGETMDGMGLASCDHAIVDHCSISWTIDEAFSSRGAKNITFQRNLISEALNVAGHRKYKKGTAHGYAGSIGGDIGSFHHSLLAHNAGRNWSLAGSIDQANRHAGRIDIRNMVVYNWHHRTTDGGAREVQFVNNYYKPGPASKVLTYLNPHFENPAFGPQQYYVEGNVMEGVSGPEGPVGPFAGMQVKGKQHAPATVMEPFFEPYIRTHSAETAYENVLGDVGCNVPMLDEHDTRVIAETRSGTVTYRGSRSGLAGLPDSQADVGGWELYPEVHRPAGWDTDRDGLPDEWEVERGLDPNTASDAAADPDGDGYTCLEDYLNALVAQPNEKERL